MNGNKGETSVEERNIIIRLYQQGNSLREIGSTVSRSHSTIQYIINKYKKTGSVANQHRSGRPTKVSERDKRFILNQIKKDPFETSAKVAEKLKEATGTEVTPRTVRNKLHEAGLKSRIARRKPLLSKVNINKRLQFAKQHINKPKEFWENVIFSDESKYNVWGPDGYKRVWRKAGEALKKENLVPTVKGKGGNVMVWGCMAASGVGNLVLIEGIMDKYKYLNILKENLESSAEKLGLLGRYNFQHDNDPKHTSYVVREWLLYNTPHRLQTPPQSPDLNPIEHLWEELDRRIRKHKISSRNQLGNILMEEWGKIGHQVTNNLVASMPRRLQAVIHAKGGPTKY